MSWALAADGRHPLQHSAKDHVLQIEFGIGLACPPLSDPSGWDMRKMLGRKWRVSMAMAKTTIG
jgi:hypothetical protein